MVYKNSLIFVIFITLFSLSGCSVEKPILDDDIDSSYQEENPTVEPETNISIKNPHYDNNTTTDTNLTKQVISAGDEQNILENSEVNLMISILVDDVNLTKFYWEKDSKIISKEKNCTIKNLAIGTYTFIAYAIDDLNNTYSDSVDINVKKQSISNHTPEASDLSFKLREDSIFKGSLSGFDEDNDELDFLLVSYPKYGKLSGSAARLVYTPKKDFYGKDEFLYKINDGKIDSNIAKVSIDVSAVNDKPISYENDINVTEDSKNNIILLNTLDVDEDNLTYNIYNLPTNGNITYSGNEAYYTPKKDFYGDDSFYFGVNDGFLDSNLAKVTIHVTPINDAPISYEHNITIQEDTKDYNIQLNASDIDEDNLTYTIDLQPTNGTIDINNSLVKYTPNQNFNGDDSFRFFVNDGKLNSQKSLVNIKVLPVNDAPISYEQNITILEDSKDNPITLSASDIDDSNITFKRVALPLHGSIYFQNSTVLYTPQQDYFGSDFFSFVANDSKVNSNVSTVYINILNTNEVPTDIDITKADIDENSDIDSLIGEFSTKDNDQVDNHIYTFVGENNDNRFFKISENRLLLNSDLDYETPQNLDHNNNYKISIQSQDNNNSTITKDFYIKINDINEAPFFTMNSNFSIDENQKYITTLQANDHDHNALLSYFIADGDTLFEIDPQSGKLSFKIAPNFEDKNNTHTLNVGVDDGELNTTITLNIEVLNVNEKPIIYDKSVTLDENSDINTIVAELNASDIDSENLNYTITSGNINNTFTINNQGVVKVKDNSLLDFESDTNKFELTIKVSDDGGLSDDCLLTINLLDINEAPIINDKNVSIREDIANDDEVIRLDASDVDDTNLTYSIILGNDDNIFKLENHIIKIANNSSIDYETKKFYDLNIKVSDPAGLEDNATIHIMVNDASEAPSINNATFNIDENSTISTIIGTNLGSDPDGDTLTYTIDSDTFSIDNNATIKLKKLVNFEEKSIYEPMVTVSDGNFSDSATLIININDINEAPYINAKTFNLDENSTNGTIIGQMVASDEDYNDTLRYTFATSNSIFQIDENSGYVSLIDKTQIDYESTNSYSFNVNATDKDGLFAQSILTINIGNINESPTISDANFTINEDIPNDFIVGNLNFSDPEDDNLTFSIVSDNFSIFDIDDKNSTIYVYDNSQINYENRQQYQLEIEVNDNNSHTKRANIIINIDDINELPTIEDKTISIDENLTIGTKIFDIVASDPENRALRYEIINHSENIFSIDDNNNLVLLDNLNYENQTSYDFSIKVFDDINQSNTASIHININDINEAPRLNGGVYNLSENAPEGTSISLAQPGDEDEGDSVTYTILSGDDDEAFGIREDGVIEVFDSSKIDFENKSSYNLLIKASDGNLDSQVYITIDITNIDEKPVVSDLSSTTDEDIPVDITLTGMDEEGESLTFEIDSNTSHGLIDLTNNIVTYTPSLNYHGSDSFTYIAKDSNNSSLPATVTITVNDINDKPVITQLNQQTMQEDTNLTITLNATDIDGQIVSYEVFDESNITISINSNEVTFTPDLNFYGLTEVKYRAKDNDGDYSDTLTLELNITAVNDKPIGVNDSINTNEDTAITFSPLSNDTDIENDTLSISAITQPSDGVAELNGTKITYTPNTNFNGTDSFTYTPNDGIEDGLTTTVNITIDPVNDNPIAKASVSDTNVVVGTTLTFLDNNSSDVDGDILSFEWWEEDLLLSTNASFKKRNLSVGEHTITLVVNDGHGGVDRDNIDINITDKNITFSSLNIESLNATYSSMADLDNDGDLDILTTLDHDKKAVWFENHGNFDFEMHELEYDSHESEEIYSLNSIKAYDVNNDNLLDIVFTTQLAGHIAILCTNNADKTFNCTSIVPDHTDDDANFMDMADLDNDNKLDAILVLESGKLFWYKQEDDGNFSEHNTIVSDISRPYAVITEDFDKDGNIDIAVAAHGGSSISGGGCSNDATFFYKNDSNATSFTKYEVDDTHCAVSVNVADIDNDGYKDIIAISNGNQRIYWHRNLYADDKNANPPFSEKREIADNILNIRDAKAVDMNHDGMLDILSSSIDENENGKTTIYWFENINNGESWRPHIITNQAIYAYKAFAGDLDNDGNYDISSIGHHSNSKINIYKNDYPTITPLLAKASNTDSGEYNSYKKDNSTGIVKNLRTGKMWADNNPLFESDLNSTNNHCQDSNYGGFSDWRLPNIWEAYYLANPFTNTNAVNNSFESTSTTYNNYIMSDIGNVLTINQKELYGIDPTRNAQALCTREKQREFKYIRDDLNESVSEPTLEIIWDDNNDSISEASSFDEALEICQNKDMRVPNINEILSIFDNNTSTKSNKAFTQYKNNGIFWSSTLKDGDYIKFDFLNAKTTTYNDTPIYIRCVKSID